MPEPLTSEARGLFTVLRQSADPQTVAAIEHLVAEAPDRALSRINALDFAAQRRLDEERVIAAFLHAARLGIFELSWNVLCPGCGGVLDASATLKTVKHEDYLYALCAAGYQPTLDEMVEVTFTVSRHVRKIAAHEPHELPFFEYFRQIFWSSGFDIPEDLERQFEEIALDTLELPAGEKAQLSLQLPAEFLIVFEPVTHAAQFIDVKGEPTRERQNLSLVFNNLRAPTGTTEMRPGPLRLSLENRTDSRVLPGVWIAGHALHEMLGRRRPFVTAKRLLTNQTFRDIYRTDTLDFNQRLKITSMTFLFTDLKGSTELYHRVGDLVAFDLVRAHFRVLNEIVAAEAGAVVKTIGDAVMATFATPDRAVNAALRMREAMRALNDEREREDLLLKIGIHEGPCLAVVLNDRQDYFGQTVNIASRVQGLAVSRSIFATGPVVRRVRSLRNPLSPFRAAPAAQQPAVKPLMSSGRAAPPPIVYLYLAIIVVSWAANWPLMKLALADAPPLLFVLLRLAGTIALLAPALFVLRAPLLPARGERLGLFLVGQLQIAGWLIFSIIGLSIVPAGRAIVLGFTMPLWAIPNGTARKRCCLAQVRAARRWLDADQESYAPLTTVANRCTFLFS